MDKKDNFSLDSDLFWSEIHKFIEQKKMEIEDGRQEKREGGQQTRKCPNCGESMKVLAINQVWIDRCPQCMGIFLDHGELELLFKTQSKSGFIPSLKKIFNSQKSQKVD